MESVKSLVNKARKSYKKGDMVATYGYVSRVASMISGEDDSRHDQAFETIFRKIRND